MRLPQAEVYEVASFYHHFDIVKEGEAAPAPLTVRVCDSLSCEMAGAGELLARLPKLLGPGVRVVAAPCIGRCEQAPAAVVGQNPIARASCESVVAAVAAGATRDPGASLHRLRELPPRGRLRAAEGLPRRRARRRVGDRDARGLGPARPRRRGLSGRAQVAHRPRRAGAAADGHQHRRRRAGHVQGPGPARDRSAPLPRGHADRGLGGRHRSHLHLPARRVPRLPRDPRSRDRRAAGRPAGSPAARDLPAPRRRGLHLRRRVGDDRIDRRQARPAAPAPARTSRRSGCSGGRRSSTTSRRCTGCASCSSRAAPGSPRTAATSARACARSRCRGGSRSPGVKLAPAGITIQELIDEYCGGMQDRAPLLRLSSGRRVGRHPAGDDERHPARLRHAAALRLLHRLGRGHRALGPRQRCRRGAQPDALLRARVVRAVHAVPQRHRQGFGPARRADVGPGAASGPVDRDARRVDLRPRPGGAQSGRLRDQAISRTSLRPRAGRSPQRRRHERHHTRRSGADPGADGRVRAERPQGRGACRRDAAPGRRSRRRRDPAPLLQGRVRPRRQLPRRAWSRSPASACSRRRAAARRAPG